MEAEMEDSKLHEAVRYGDTNVVREALQDGLDPNAIGFLQWTPVQEAACNGDLEILQILLHNKGDPNAKDKLLGSTAVHYAAKEGHVECLQALLDNGGLYDLEDNNGLTSLDVAVGKCYDLLDNRRFKDIANTKIKTTFADTQSEPTSDETIIHEKSDELIHDLPKAWEKEPTAEENSLIHSSGHLQLSFEYNSKTKTFKIRVWMLHDLLLPPVEASTINRIYVRSQLLPDKKGDSKRRTEEHILGDKLWNQTMLTLKRKGHKESFKAIFLPCSFKFSKALEYRNITKDIVLNRVVHLDVCAKQKYGRNFVIANIQIALKDAVKKLIKEKFLLHPCINICMPDNVHAYDPKDLLVCPEGMYRNLTTSNPNIRTKSKQSLSVENDTRRATSDNDLKAVRCHSTDSIPSIVVNVPESNEDMSEILEEIHIMDTGPKTSFISKSNPEFTSIEMQEMSLPHSMGDELREVRVQPGSHSTPNITIIDMEDAEDNNFYANTIINERQKIKTSNLKVGTHKPGYVIDIRENTSDSLMFKKRTKENISVENKLTDKLRSVNSHQNNSDISKKHAKTKNVDGRTSPQGIANQPDKQKTQKVDKATKKGIKLKRAKQEKMRISPITSVVPKVITLDETAGGTDSQPAHLPVKQYTFSNPITRDLVQTELGSVTEVIELDEIKKGKTSNLHPWKSDDRAHNPQMETSLERGVIFPPIGKSSSNSTRLHIETEESDLAKAVHLKKMLATPEFRRQMFQRTKDVEHPALAYLGSRNAEEHELVCIPGTPMNSPLSTVSGSNTGRNSPSTLHQGHEHLSENLRNIEKPTLGRLQQSWL